MRRDYIRNTFTTDIFIEVIHLLTNKIVYAHLLTLPVVPTSLRYRGSITLENLTLTSYYCYSVLDIEWEAFHLYIHHDPIILPKYIFGFQPNLLTDFKAPGPYRIQFIASYLDLCTPIPPANMHDAIPYHTEDTRLKHVCLFLLTKPSITREVFVMVKKEGQELLISWIDNM